MDGFGRAMMIVDNSAIRRSISKRFDSFGSSTSMLQFFIS